MGDCDPWALASVRVVSIRKLTAEAIVRWKLPSHPPKTPFTLVNMTALGLNMHQISSRCKCKMCVAFAVSTFQRCYYTCYAFVICVETSSTAQRAIYSPIGIGRGSKPSFVRDWKAKSLGGHLNHSLHQRARHLRVPPKLQRTTYVLSYACVNFGGDWTIISTRMDHIST
jgi:hypothetical protein